MQHIITPIAHRFMDFIARVFVPQSVFFIFFMLFDFIFTDFKYSSFLLSHFVEHLKAAVFLILIVSVGWGFVVAFINQVYDRFNTGNFDSLFSFNSDSCYRLEKLRKNVVVSLSKNNKLPFPKKCDINTIKDYHLYEILGNTTVFPTLGNVVSFNDRANYSYTLVTTLLINLGFFFFFTNSIEYELFLKVLIFSIVFIILFVGAVFVARRYYRERNIRLYVNYLLETGVVEEKSKGKNHE